MTKKPKAKTVKEPTAKSEAMDCPHCGKPNVTTVNCPRCSRPLHMPDGKPFTRPI